MSYDPAIKIYDSAGAGTPDDITESILGTLEFQLAAMGGCLGASFRLAGGAPYTPSAGDHRIRVGIRVTTASGPPEEYQWYPAGDSAAPDYDSAAVRPVFDPAANAVLLVQALQPVGYPV